MHQIQEHFNVMNRIVAARLSARLERSDPETDDGMWIRFVVLLLRAKYVNVEENLRFCDVYKSMESEYK